jgi:ribonuclease R
LKIVHDLFKKLLDQRQLRGAIEFETTETRIIFGAQSKIDRISPVERNDAHKKIEEAMLVANVCTARFLQKEKITSLYRIHAGPEPQRLLALHSFLRTFGLRLSGGNEPEPKDYSKLVQRIMKRPDFHLLQTVMLRSLRQAVYSPENDGHFGLAYDAYTHFTSPIRRFPDLIVHRSIKQALNAKNAKKEFSYTEKNMYEIGNHCSMTERRADLASRDATDWLKCEYMQHKLGQTFSGVISDVTNFGVFVELNDIYVQGLLHVTSLVNDYYQYDTTNHLLRGRHSGKKYCLGDPITVLVARVDLDKRAIDFELPNVQEEKRKARKMSQNRSRRKKNKSTSKTKPKKSSK